MAVDAAAYAAIRDYRRYRASLEREASTDEKDQRPLTARKKRNYARIVVRACLAEQFDPRPDGIGEFK
jgi:hypothetical protein